MPENHAKHRDANADVFDARRCHDLWLKNKLSASIREVVHQCVISKPSKLTSEFATTTLVCHQVTYNVCSHKTTSLSLLLYKLLACPDVMSKLPHCNCVHGPRIIGTPPQKSFEKTSKG